MQIQDLIRERIMAESIIEKINAILELNQQATQLKAELDKIKDGEAKNVTNI